MSGSRLGRGRGGRLAVYGGCGVVVILLVFLYRAATSEMARLRELHVECAHQQEALAAQLQVIYEYKVRLEKSLAEEKSSNAAVKQELQQRASREKSLRDKDSIEAMQRFNSLQQTYKLLQTEHQDLKDECKKREKQALEDTNRLETTLQDLRSRMRQACEDKQKALEHLKNKYLELETEKTRVEGKYNEMLKSSGNTNSVIDHLKKEVFQLRNELEEAKKLSGRSTSPGPSLVSPQSSQQMDQQHPGRSGAASQQPSEAGPSQQQQQQVSRPSSDNGNVVDPLHAPRDHRAIGQPLSREENDEALPNEQLSDVHFGQKDDSIVPIGPNDVKDEEQRKSLPLPYDFQQNREKNKLDSPYVQEGRGDEKRVEEGAGNGEDDQGRQVLRPPSGKNEENAKKSSSSGPTKGTNEKDAKKRNSYAGKDGKRDNLDDEELGKLHAEEDELKKLQDESTAATSSVKAIPVLRSESSTTSSSGNLASTALDKSGAAKPASKLKIPPGVPPIPVIVYQKLDNRQDKRQQETRKKEEPGQSPQVKDNADSKENEQLVDPGRQDPAFSAGRHAGGQAPGRRANGGWFRVAPGVQEIGDELNQLGRLSGLEDGAERQEAGDEQYEGADYGLRPKNNDLHWAAVEDEGEDEDDLDYPQNLKQEKHE